MGRGIELPVFLHKSLGIPWHSQYCEALQGSSDKGDTFEREIRVKWDKFFCESFMDSVRLERWFKINRDEKSVDDSVGILAAIMHTRWGERWGVHTGSWTLRNFRSKLRGRRTITPCELPCTMRLLTVVSVVSSTSSYPKIPLLMPNFRCLREYRRESLGTASAVKLLFFFGIFYVRIHMNRTMYKEKQLSERELGKLG